jgi:hypothetical protein
MTTPPAAEWLARAVEPGDVAIVHCPETFTFLPGSRQRAAGCLLCGEMIGGRPVKVIGAAALAGDPCRCGGIVSDVFLIHADHYPLSAADLQAAIRRGLECGASH